MSVSRNEMKVEAVMRMEMLHVFPQTISQFKDDGKISMSEPPYGALYWIDGDDLERVKQFEEKHDALVYIVIRSYTPLGKMDCYLYVSQYQEEWEQDRNDIENIDEDSGLLAYVFNHDAPDCSEFGYIGIAHTPASGLIRTW